MKVLHFRGEFSRLSETFIYSYVKELEKKGVDNHVVTFCHVNKKSRPFPKVHTINRPSRLNPRRVYHKVITLLGAGGAERSAWPQVRERLGRLIQEMEPDIIHCHFGPAGVIMGPVAQKLGIPLIVAFYGYDISSLTNKRFWKTAYDNLWQQVDVVAVLSDEMKKSAEELGCPSCKLRILHLGCDLEQFHFRLPEPPVKSVLFVGRLTSKKAPLDGIRAVQKANEQGSNLTLDIVGGGGLQEKVRSLIYSQGLSEFVTVHGRLPNAEVARQMQSADAFLLPSKTTPSGDKEGTPTVLVEAQATGLPCVSTRHAGIPEMIPKENHSLLAAEGDVEGLSEILVDLSSLSVRKLKRISKRGRRKVESDFSLTMEVEKLKKIYRNI